jgi:secondary thiamine-phosphate synthase enzyme
MLVEYTLKTAREEFRDITVQVREAVRQSQVADGLCLVFCPHTTAAITINEDADPDVVHDLLFALDRTYPDRPEFRHCEGNSAAHLKSSCVGCSVTIPVEAGQLVLGTWQGVYFCEFDGPRTRRFLVKVM